MSDEPTVRAAWGSLGAASAADRSGLDDLLARHREPHRRYHTLPHVAAVLAHVDHLLGAAAGDAGPLDAAALRAAALFHDAVYDPRRSDNEAASAELARRRASAWGWDDARLGTLERLVLATAGHEASALDEAILLDADLAVLGAPPDAYAAYVAAVRAEYAFVDEPAWRVGRAAVLRSFLDRPAIYATPTMRAARESAAQANLTGELAGLVA